MASAVPELRVTKEGADFTAPPLPNDEGPDVEIWRDVDGTVCAYGQVLGEDCWMHLVGVGSFRFRAADDTVYARPAGGTSSQAVADAYRRTILPMALQVQGWEVLHASAVQGPSGVVALCGVKETGKSTVAYAMSQRGYALWADDAVAFTTEHGFARALSLPFQIRLRPASAAFFSAQTGIAKPQVAPTAASTETVPSPLAAVCVMQRVGSLPGGPCVEKRRLAAADAFTAVLAHGYCFTLRDGVRKQAMMKHYLDLVTDVPIFDLTYATGLDTLPAVVDALEEIAIGLSA